METEIQTDVIFDWTTGDELNFMRGFFERCRVADNFGPFKLYARNIQRRRWDSTVDSDLVTLEANELVKKAGRIQALNAG